MVSAARRQLGIVLMVGLALVLLPAAVPIAPICSTSCVQRVAALQSAKLSQTWQSACPEPLWTETFGHGEDEQVWDMVEVTSSSGASVLVMAGSAETYYSRPFGPEFALFWIFTDDTGTHGSVFGGSNGTQVFHSITKTPDGWVHAVGATEGPYSGSTGGYDAYLESDGPGSTYLPDSAYGGLSDDFAYSATNCSDGGVAIAGSTQSYGVGGRDVWLLHTDPNNFHTGTEMGKMTRLLWNQTYGGPLNEEAFSVVVCHAGGYALAGYTESYGAGGRDAWLLRTDEDGRLLWNHTYGGANSDEIYAVIECHDGSFAMIGTTRSYGAGFRDMWLLRTTSDGQLLSSTTFGGPYSDVGYDLIEVSDGGFLIIGYTNSFGAGSSDMWVLRLNSDGGILWQQTFGGPDTDEGRAVLESKVGGYALAGITWSYGEDDGAAWVVRLPEDRPPAWVKAPTDQVLLENLPLSYDLDATDSSGVDHWWVNDTAHFAVDKNGVVSNAVSLRVGVYGVEVCVDDVYGNVLTGSFRVTVVPLLLTIRPESWMILIIGITICVLPFVAPISRRLRSKLDSAA